MNTSQLQAAFLQDVARLILWAADHNMQLTGGELYRSKEQQDIYVKSGKSQTSKSKHLERLAIDLNLFIAGEYKTDRESYKPLADYWKSLNPDNKAGYDWGFDANHFQRT